MKKWLGYIQFYAMVTFLAVLVWLYAEGQDVRTVEVSCRLRLTTSQGYAVMPSTLSSLKVTFQGASGKIDDLRQRLAMNDELTLSLVADNFPEGEATPLRLAERLRDASFMDRDGNKTGTIETLGINVMRVEPEERRIVVDELVQQKLTVVFAPEGFKIAGLSARPSTVTLTMPKSVMTELAVDMSNLTVRAQVPELRLRELPRGVPQIIRDVPVALPELLASRSDITVAPPNVDLSFTIARSEDKWVAESVPVWIDAPPAELAQYHVVLGEDSRLIQDVTIIGPSDLIRQFKQNKGEYSVVALVGLTPEHLAKSVSTAPVSAIVIRRIHDGAATVVSMIPLPRSPGGAGSPTQQIRPLDMRVETEKNSVNLKISRRPS